MTTRKFHGPEKLRHVSNFTAAFFFSKNLADFFRLAHQPRHTANGININSMSPLFSPCISFTLRNFHGRYQKMNQKSHKNLSQGNVNGRFLKGVRKNLQIFGLNNTKINLILLS